jgi:hypothetical protein
MQPHTNPESHSRQRCLRPSKRVRRARRAMDCAARLFFEAALLTTDQSRSARLSGLGAALRAALPCVLRIERDLERTSRRPS